MWFCRHKFDMSDMINIESKLPTYTSWVFDDELQYKRNLPDWRIICPCWKCGKVFHASCGIDLLSFGKLELRVTDND